jgi:hypothetical protein
VLGVFFFFFVVVVVVALLELLLVVVVVVLVLVVVVVLLLALVVAATFVLTTLVDLVVVDGLFYSWFIVIEDNASRTSERIPSKPMNNKSWAYAGTYYYVDGALLIAPRCYTAAAYLSIVLLLLHVPVSLLQ